MSSSTRSPAPGASRRRNALINHRSALGLIIGGIVAIGASVLLRPATGSALIEVAARSGYIVASS